jgi:hypothetical protein
MCRAVGGGLQWCLGWLVPCVEAWPEHVQVQPRTGHPDVMRQRLQGEADAPRRLVQKKAHTPWRGRAMDVKSRQVMAFPAGDRRRKSAKGLGAKRPVVDREPAIFDPAQ